MSQSFDAFNRLFVSSLADFSDSEIDKIHSLVWSEKQLRTKRKINRRDYPMLLDSEIQLARVNKIDAVLNYNRRTGVGIYVAKGVVETMLSKE